MTLADHPERHTLETAQGVVFNTAIGLIKQDYPTALTPEAQERYREEIPVILQRTVEAGLNSFAVRLTMASTPDEYVNSDTINWFALFMNTLVDQSNGRVRCIPSGNNGTIDYMVGFALAGGELNSGRPPEKIISIFELGWVDVVEDFDPTPYLS